jgi:hypothetical protein
VTPEGRRRYAAYWRHMETFRKQAADGRFTFRLRPATRGEDSKTTFTNTHQP